MAETETLKKVMLKLGAKKWLKIWRNNTGQAWQGKRFGLKRGTRVVDEMGRSIVIEPGDILIKGAVPSTSVWQDPATLPELSLRTAS